jgi:hypothetical protein
MNKRYEKFINKKFRNANKTFEINPSKFGYSFLMRNQKLSTRTLSMRKKVPEIFTDINPKNIYKGFGLNNPKNKIKLQPGMFSYKRSTNSNLSNSLESNNSIERNNYSMISNKLISNNPSNKNHPIFQNLKLFLGDAEISSIKTLTNNDNISNQFHFHNHSAMNLNKYKINNISYKKNKSMDFSNVHNNTFNNTNFNYDFMKYNNIIINNINQPSIKLSSDEINIKPKKDLKMVNNLSQFLNKAKGDKEKNNTLFTNNFLFKSKAENESRRMIIEYLKVLKQKEKNKYKIVNILKNQNISDKVLNQQKVNTNLNIYTMNSKNSKFFYLKSNKKVDFPGESINLRNISKFLKDMNDITKDKISMIKFLSIPRIMGLIFMEKDYKFIFMLKPNRLSYLKGLESYIFQWSDIKTKKEIGGFDLLKVNSCCINSKQNENVLIETFDGLIHRQYELITKSKDDASNIVKSINYLSRLEKCKIYNKKYE